MMTLEHVTKRYRTKRGDIVAIDDLSLEIEPGQLIALKGPSGSGKTTVLLAAGSMLKPTEGTVRLDGEDAYTGTGGQRAAFRRDHIGFVFQMFHLIPYLSVLENVVLAKSAKQDRTDCVNLLEHFRLGDRIHHRPAELSAGERQRAAVARALIRRPKLVLADEPTGNLDPENSDTVMRYLSEYAQEGGMVLVATHAELADDYVARTVYLKSGKMETAV